jgi:hypothetical protein
MKEKVVNSYKGKRALLIGNGVSRMDDQQAISWKKLLEVIKGNLNLETDLDNKFKPFSLGFEEMLHRSETGDFHDKLKGLKKSIRSSIDQQLLIMKII